MLIIFIQNVLVEWGGTDALIHPGLQGPCGDLVFLTGEENKRPSVSHWKPVAPPGLPPSLPPSACCACPLSTYMTCTTTPMPDTASLSTAFSMAWEMVSNRSSGSCTIKHVSPVKAGIWTHFNKPIQSNTVTLNPNIWHIMEIKNSSIKMYESDQHIFKLGLTVVEGFRLGVQGLCRVLKSL